jgi:hypothetical protein
MNRKYSGRISGKWRYEMNKKISKPVTQDAGFKGELVDSKDSSDFEPTGRNMNNNPYKTPPNNLTSKRKR